MNSGSSAISLVKNQLDIIIMSSSEFQSFNILSALQLSYNEVFHHSEKNHFSILVVANRSTNLAARHLFAHDSIHFTRQIVVIVSRNSIGDQNIEVSLLR
jgi:archaellin